MALLFAPNTGKKTRRAGKIRQEGGQPRQKFVGEIGESMDDVLGDILEYGQDGMEKGRAVERSRPRRDPGRP